MVFLFCMGMKISFKFCSTKVILGINSDKSVKQTTKETINKLSIRIKNIKKNLVDEIIYFNQNSTEIY